MLNNILHRIAAALGTAAAYMYWDDFLSLVKKLFMLSLILSVVFMLYAGFYLNEPLAMIVERFSKN